MEWSGRIWQVKQFSEIISNLYILCYSFVDFQSHPKFTPYLWKIRKLQAMLSHPLLKSCCLQPVSMHQSHVVLDSKIDIIKYVPFLHIPAAMMILRRDYSNYYFFKFTWIIEKVYRFMQKTTVRSLNYIHIIHISKKAPVSSVNHINKLWHTNPHEFHQCKIIFQWHITLIWFMKSCEIMENHWQIISFHIVSI